MNILIDVEKINIDVQGMIADKLRQNNIPECFGMMVLPLIYTHQEFRMDEVMELTKSVNVEDRLDVDTSSFVQGSEGLIDEFCFSKKSYQKLVEFFDNKANEYVEQAKKCISCDLIDKCCKLTQNYHSIVSLKK